MNDSVLSARSEDGDMPPVDSISHLAHAEEGGHSAATKPQTSLHIGELWTGVVSSVDADGIVFGSDGPFRVSCERDEWLGEAPQVGRSYEVFVDEKERNRYRVSQRKAGLLHGWNYLKERHQEGLPVKGRVVSQNSHGFVVDVSMPGLDCGVRGFLPGGKVIAQRQSIQVLQTLELDFHIERLNHKKFDLLLNRNAYLESELEEARRLLFQKLSVGTLIEGEVVRFTDYGAFVDLGCIDGLLHIDEIAWTKIKTPSERLKLGQVAAFKVISLNPEEGRIGLSYKQLTSDPWQNVEERYPLGEAVSGQVSGMTEYGVFVRLEDGLEGLLHLSEVSWTDRIQHPKERFALGDELVTKVLDIDSDGRRLSLGLKQLEANPWEALATSNPVGSQLEGPIRSITDFGLFVRVQDGIDGLVHLSDIAWDRAFKNKDALNEVFKVGETLKAVVKSLDIESQRMGLSLKALQPDPLKAFAQNHPRGSTLTGSVHQVVAKGAVFIFDGGVEGFCPKAQVSVDPVERVDAILSVGQSHEVMVSRIDFERRRIIVSIKALSEGLDDAYRDYMNDDTAGFGHAFAEALQKDHKTKG